MLSLSDRADVSVSFLQQLANYTTLEVILKVPIKVHKYWSSSFS